MATDWRDINDEREKYAAYLCSREWSVLKQSVHERAQGLCERCFTRGIDAVHHLTYIRKYDERLEDLQGLCNGCHEFTHGKSSVDPREVEDREAISMRCVYRKEDLLIDMGSWVIGLEGSIGISVFKGLCTADDVLRVVQRALRLAEALKADGEERQ